MYSSIQYFVENGIPQLEKLQKNFMMNPSCMEVCVNGVKETMLEIGCLILSEIFGECNTILEESGKRREHWRIKDRSKKQLLTSLGVISFTHKRFEH